jgi:hypothetical protein
VHHNKKYDFFLIFLADPGPLDANISTLCNKRLRSTGGIQYSILIMLSSRSRWDDMKVLDITMKGSRSLLPPCGLIYAFAYGHGNCANDDFMGVAAMAAAVLSWQFHGSFLVHQ